MNVVTRTPIVEKTNYLFCPMIDLATTQRRAAPWEQTWRLTIIRGEVCLSMEGEDSCFSQFLSTLRLNASGKPQEPSFFFWSVYYVFGFSSGPNSGTIRLLICFDTKAA